MSKQSLDHILDAYGGVGHPNPISKREAKQAIVEAVEGLAPEKIRSNSAFVQVADPVMREFKQAQANGYNQAVDDFLKAIKEWQ